LHLLRLRNPWGSVEYNGDWSKRSSKWTDDLKGKVGFDDLKNDPGLFFIEWKEWTDAFRNLTICLEANPSKYKHSGQTLIDFNDDEWPHTFLKLKLDQDYNCDKEAFAINFYQQGPRLEGYKIGKFRAANFSMALMTASGDYIQGGSHGGLCSATLLIKEGTLKAGEYIIHVAAKWGTSDHPDFKRVLADIYST